MLDEPFSPFLPTTQNIPEDEQSFRYFLNNQFSKISDVINDKTIGIFSTAEQQNGEKWFYGNTSAQVKKVRNGLQIIVFIPNLTTQSIANPIDNVNNDFVMTFAYATASKLKTDTTPGDYFSFLGNGDTRAKLTISDTIITIATDGSLASYQAFIVMQYIKSGN